MLTVEIFVIYYECLESTIKKTKGMIRHFNFFFVFCYYVLYESFNLNL